MPKGRSAFKRTDVKRLVLALQDAGIKVGGVKMDKAGNVTVIPGDAQAIWRRPKT